MKVSYICLGCMGFGDVKRAFHKWVLDKDNCRPVIKKALELGISFFDTANVSSSGTSEEFLGRALKDSALSVRLTPEEVAYLKEPYVPHRIVAHQ